MIKFPENFSDETCCSWNFKVKSHAQQRAKSVISLRSSPDEQKRHFESCELRAFPFYASVKIIIEVGRHNFALRLTSSKFDECSIMIKFISSILFIFFLKYDSLKKKLKLCSKERKSKAASNLILCQETGLCPWVFQEINRFCLGLFSLQYTDRLESSSFL